MLPKHDVFITDWRDAKLVPVSEGSFDLDDYIDYLIEFSQTIYERTGKRPHMLAVCQPSVPAYAATAIMNADKHPARPKTLTMMGGPVDTRKAPTAVNTLATQRPHAWFQQNVIATVPMIYPGAGRKVYPGFPAAGRVHDHEPRHPPHQPLGDVQASGGRRRRERGRDARLLRRISVGVRHDRRILPADGRRGVPAAPAAQGRARASRPAGSIPRRSRTRRCWRSRASATISAASARPRPGSTWRPAWRPQRSNITSPGTSAITASSTAASGARRSRPWSRSSSPRTPSYGTSRSILSHFGSPIQARLSAAVAAAACALRPSFCSEAARP